ncbi:MAG: SpoIIE family protein phosphatase [Ruminococcus sp.]|nr:SpoIIE family protein phosphatase [Ruminococcus sp.]
MKLKGIITEKKGIRESIEFIISVTAGFILSGTELGGVTAFTDIATAGALEISGCTGILTGGILFSFLFGDIGRNIVKLSAIVLILISKLLSQNRTDPKMCGIYTAVSVFLSGTAVSLVIGELFKKLIFYLFYSIFTGAAAYSATAVINTLREKKVLDLTAYGYCYAVVYVIYTASLCSVKIPVINIGILFGTFITLLSVYYYGHTGGVMCGAMTAFAAFLSSTETGMTAVLLPAVSMLTGYTKRNRTISCAIVFILINTILMVLTGITHNSIYTMVNVITASALFTVAEPFLSDRWIKTSSDKNNPFQEIITSRMQFMSDTIENVRRDSDKIAETLLQREREENYIEGKIGAVCSKCFRKTYCKRKGSTESEGLDRLIHMSEISMETFPAELEECVKKHELIKAHKSGMKEDTYSMLTTARYNDRRELLSEQMKTIEEIIRKSTTLPDTRRSQRISGKIEKKLKKFGYEPSFVTACYNKVNRLIAEIYFTTENAPETSTRICDLISDELKIQFNSTEPISSGKEIRIRIYEPPKYALDVYRATASADNSEENGDTSLVFSDGTGKGCIVLSDGMGSGNKAAFESRITVRLFKKLINSGVDLKSAVKLINSIMLSKSKDEAFATLDVISLDLYSCESTVTKCGAAATIIRHNNNVCKITSKTFPVGIYEKSEIFTTECEFAEGDIAIMFSDGISEGEYLFIKELLLGSNDLKKIVDEICSKAEKFKASEKSDDITVIGFKLFGN